MKKLIISSLLILILSACSTTPVINYKRSEFGVLIACVEGESTCRELSEEVQKKHIQTILNLYQCNIDL